MDGRILNATEKMMRDLYGLENYESRQCNVKTSTIEMEMSNGLIVLKAKIPRSLIEDTILMNDTDELMDDDSVKEEKTPEPVSEEPPKEEDKTTKKKLLKRGKK